MDNYFGNRYPYTDYHELNLDWLIRKMRELDIKFDEFKVVNNITFSGQWDITKQYPAWTIVSDNNIGYVSQRPVPVGVPLTNGSYWVEVIDYTAQIAGLEQRVINLENEDIVINGRIDNTNERIDVLHDREIVLLGDSYGVDATAGGVSWATIVQNNLSDLTIYRNTVGGTGFASDLYITDNNLTLLQALNIPDRDRVKNIVILGGANDANLYSLGTLDEPTLVNRINTFMTYCRTNFKNAVVKVGFVGWNRAMPLNDYITVAQIYQRECNKYSNCRYYNKGEVIMHNMDHIAADDIHPTQTASNLLGEFAISVINDSDYNYYQHYEVGFTAGAGYTINGNVYADVMYDDNMTQLTLLSNQSGGFIQVVPNTPIIYNNYMCLVPGIGKFDNMLKGVNRHYGYCNMRNKVSVVGKGVKEANVLITYYDNSLGVRVYDVTDAVNGVDSISGILIPPFTLNYETRLN